MKMNRIEHRLTPFFTAALLMSALGGCFTVIDGVGTASSSSSAASSGAGTSSSGGAGGGPTSGAGGAGAGPQTGADALYNAGQCMSRAAFSEQGLDQLFNLQTEGACTCATCHAATQATGNGGGFILDPDPDVTFAAAQQLPGILNFMRPVTDPSGSFNPVDASHGIELKSESSPSCDCNSVLALATNGVIDVNDPAYCHPAYLLSLDVADRINFFVQTALVRSSTVICTPQNTP